MQIVINKNIMLLKCLLISETWRCKISVWLIMKSKNVYIYFPNSLSFKFHGLIILCNYYT